jgi:hypothetical protein
MGLAAGDSIAVETQPESNVAMCISSARLRILRNPTDTLRYAHG